MAVDAAPRGRLAFGLKLGALAWSLALIPAALLVPVYASASQSTAAPGVVAHGGATLVALNGTGALIAVAVPTAITLAVWAALHRMRTRAGRLAGRLAASRRRGARGLQPDRDVHDRDLHDPGDADAGRRRPGVAARRGALISAQASPCRPRAGACGGR